ncbi:AbrB/MazE/SpoVT family DNA-binding domain-containing protein [Thermococcus sp.]|uniref:AbrB/MazE/SpoVT family DNA-binding domain-containing protein n=1 Tax=Thermococcus sp. TaxID=35749 RepID=UPI00345BE6EE
MPVVTKKYQVTIPKEVREALGIKAGDKVVFVRTKEGYVIKPLDDFLREMAEIMKDVDETVEEVRKGLARGIARSLRELGEKE